MQARQITLNLVPGGVMPRIHCSQYDKGVPVEVTIYDGDTTYTIPQDATVYVQGTKLDGTLYQYECTYSGSVVYFDLTIQMTVIAGENTAELSIYDSNEDIVGTCNFVIDVEDSALQDSSETSYNDIPVIADLPGLVKTAEKAAQTAVDAADGVELDMDEIREAVSKSSTSAQLASGYAVDSENYYLLSKSYAVGDTSRVGSSVDNAMYYMNLAKGYSEDTAEDVQTVEELMEDLEEIETRTKGYSDSAALSKTSVDTLYSQTVIAKTSADYFATLAESWAHGQTGIRQDESVDNAMYWANKAQAVAKTTVDSAFSTSSLNPVENRVITNQHVNVKINQVNGVHGLRYYNDLLEYYDTDTSQWVEIETGGGTLIVQPPVAASQTYTYDGTEQTFQFSSIDTANCTISNNKKTAAGTYTVTVSLKETNYVWADDLTNADRTFTWTINKAQVAIPVAASQSYTYDGTQQTFAFSSIDSNNVTVSGDKQTNAGSYTVSCALNDTNNNEWSDSSTAAKEYTWTIAKAASSISVSPASITFDANNLTATLVPTTTGDGTVSYAIDKPSIATIAGNVVTATQTTGTATITATISETTNYASASTTISVTAQFAPPYGWTLLDYINRTGTKTSQADIDDYVMVALFQRSGTDATGSSQGGVLVPTGIFKERAIASEYASPVQATYSNNGIDLNSGVYGLQLWGHNTGDMGEYELIGQATNETKNISSIDLSEYAEILLLFIAPNETRALNSVMLPIGLFTSLCGTAPLSCSWDQKVHGSSSYAKVTYVSNSQITLQGASCTAMVYGIKGISRTSTYLGESTQSTTGNVQTTIDNINLYKELLFMCMSSSKNQIYNLVRFPISLFKNIQGDDKGIDCILANNTTASYITYIDDTTVKFTGHNATHVLYGIS